MGLETRCLTFTEGHRSGVRAQHIDRKSTRLNSSHSQISYAVFCLKKKDQEQSVPTPCECAINIRPAIPVPLVESAFLLLIAADALRFSVQVVPPHVRAASSGGAPR